jgi:hypothetical protein
MLFLPLKESGKKPGFAGHAPAGLSEYCEGNPKTDYIIYSRSEKIIV